MLILSLFPGIDLLGRGFEEAGYCVVRGPDIVWGGDIRTFTPPSGRFDGVIAGSPCQDFSNARRCRPSGYGVAMLQEFIRVVEAARPEWWLLENVPGVPDMAIPGYGWQRLDLRASEFGLTQRRLRHFQFGHKNEFELIIERHKRTIESEACCLASDSNRQWSKFCTLQGLPHNFELPYFTVSASYRAVGNGVPLPMAKALAEAINGLPYESVTPCGCGCGRAVTGRAIYANAACRKRVQRRREKESCDSSRSV